MNFTAIKAQALTWPEACAVLGFHMSLGCRALGRRRNTQFWVKISYYVVGELHYIKIYATELKLELIVNEISKAESLILKRLRPGS